MTQKGMHQNQHRKITAARNGRVPDLQINHFPYLLNVNTFLTKARAHVLNYFFRSQQTSAEQILRCESICTKKGILFSQHKPRLI